MYTITNFKSKKQLKEAVAAYNTLIVPTILETSLTGNEPKRSGPAVRYFQPGPFGGNEPRDGTFAVEGPHYPKPHSWYATCTAKDGVIVKVK